MKIKNIRKYLTHDACVQITLVLVIFHLDYVNGALYNIPKCDLNKLQRIQNLAAKIVLKKNRRDSATKCLKLLH